MTPQSPGSVRAAGRLRLIYVGADAELAPAGSLRALAGAGAVFVPADLPAGLRAGIVAAAGSATAGDPPAGGAVRVDAGDAGAAADTAVCRLVELDAGDPSALLDEARRRGAVLAVAGPLGPDLVRRVRSLTATDTGLLVSTVPAAPLFEECLTGQALVSLLRVTRVLRRRCPWDRVQTAGDIVSCSLEEVYELVDAVAAGDRAGEHGELGDVLFQVYFLAVLLEEQDAGDLGSVALSIERKLIRRHTHIFGDAVAGTPAAVRGQWERIKREQEGRRGIFHDVPASLPALLFARKLQRRAAEVGFDWETAQQAFPKIAEEHGELRSALVVHGPVAGFDDPQAGASPAAAGSERAAAGDERETSRVEMRHDSHLRHEFGDLLFAVVNVARKAGIDPELALREAAQRFERRVTGAAHLAAAEGRDWAALGLDEQESYYRRAKRAER